MNRLREDVLGSSDGASEVEAKAASWQKFNSKTTPKRKRAVGMGGTGGRGENTTQSTRVSSEPTGWAGPGTPATNESEGENHWRSGPGRGGLSAGGADDSRRERGCAGGTSGTDPPNVVREKPAAGPAFVCLVCRRGFKSAKGLAHHEANSELHEITMQLRDLMSPSTHVTTHSKE